MSSNINMIALNNTLFQGRFRREGKGQWGSCAKLSVSKNLIRQIIVIAPISTLLAFICAFRILGEGRDYDSYLNMLSSLTSGYTNDIYDFKDIGFGVFIVVIAVSNAVKSILHPLSIILLYKSFH